MAAAPMINKHDIGRYLSTLAFLETVIDEYRLKDHRKTINEIRNIVLKEYQNQRYFKRKIPVFFAQKRV